MFFLPRWIHILRNWRRRRRELLPGPGHGVFSEHVAASGSLRRYSRIVDIRMSEGGHKLSTEVLMILVLVLEEDWLLFPTREELDAR
jgi:hypothetical protein